MTPRTVTKPRHTRQWPFLCTWNDGQRAPRVAVSNWNVQDDSTKDFMLDFHRRLYAGGGAAKALREAKLAMRKSGKRKHPYYWAPFVLWGLPE